MQCAVGSVRNVYTSTFKVQLCAIQIHSRTRVVTMWHGSIVGFHGPNLCALTGGDEDLYGA